MMTPLLMLPHLHCSTECPGTCKCHPNGAVVCVGNSITDVPKQIPATTYLLQMHNTNMTEIQERSLAGLDLMLRFSLTHSLLHAVHPEAFRVAPQLLSVKLSSNRLVTLPPRIFSPLTHLDQLLLDGNRLESIAPKMFEGLSDLQEIDLSRNNLASLAAGLFTGLSKLHFLNLGRNYIKELPPTIFHPLTNLKTLFIYNNEIKTLDGGMFAGLDNLTQLKLHYNQIGSLPPQLFWSLRKMNTLTLSANRLQTIPEKTFYHMPEMKKLTIYNNPLLTLPDQLMGHMPQLQEFYLYNTKLATLPPNLFANTSGMITLNVHINERLSELPSDLFCCLPFLDKLSLKSNQLVRLHPQLFSRLPRLRLLYLNDNKLQGLPGDIFRALTQVSTIDLENNQLTTLPGESFLTNSALKFLNLSGNPWDCGCGIRGIAKWIKHHQGVVVDIDRVICSTRDDRARRTISSLSDDDFLHCDALMGKSRLPTWTRKPTSRAQSAAPPTSPVATATPEPQTVPQHVTVLTSSTPALPLQASTSSLPNTEAAPPSQAPSAHMPTVFYHKMVLDADREYVHNNHLRGVDYIWFLPSETTFTWGLMFSHVLLVATGVFLLLATLYYLYRLDKSINKLRAEP